VIYLRQFEANTDDAERVGREHQSKGTLAAAPSPVQSQLLPLLPGPLPVALKMHPASRVTRVCDHHTQDALSFTVYNLVYFSGPLNNVALVCALKLQVFHVLVNLLLPIFSSA
jgi:hypothetical protein